MRSEGSKEIGCEILHVNTERSMRGGEVQTLGLMRGLEVRGVKCSLVAWDLGALLERAWGEGFQVIPWRPRGELDLWAARKLRGWISRSGARVIHAHTAHALTLVLLAAKGLTPRPKVVASRRVSFPLRSIFSRWKYRAADAVVAVSGEVARGLVKSGLEESKVFTIHSGVDLSKFVGLLSRQDARARFGIPGDAKAIGVVGALVAHKGHRVLLKALAHLDGDGGHPLLLLAGDGHLKSQLAARAGDLGVDIRFLGYVKAASQLYPALDLLVLPSLSGEGSPGVIKEAAAAGIPVVATDVSGTTEILRDGLEALIVPPNDAIRLAEAIGRMLAEPGLAQSLAEAAHFRAREFTMDKMAQAHLDLYTRLLEDKGQ